MSLSEASGSMSLILLVILMLCGYLALLKYVFDRAANRSAFPLLAVLLLLLYGGICGALYLILRSMGSDEVMLLGFLILGACVTVFLMLSYLLRHFREMRAGWLAMFVTYLLVLGYITVFSRDGTNSTAILAGFTSFEEALETHSLQPLNHFLLNVVMFIPLGFLFVMMQPSRLDRVLLVLPISTMLSVTIETIQLMLRLGQCDLEDIVANALGGVIGLLLYRVAGPWISPDSGRE